MIAAIANILGWIIRIIYNHTNYFISILLFTILTKLILLPLYISQIKSTEEMNKIGPMAKKIQDKYKNDKNKQAEELTKLYAEHKVNPIGGCLPALIQIPLIFAMFYIVKQPLTYVINMPQEQIIEYTKQYLGREEVSEKEARAYEINVANEYGLIDMNVGKYINLGKAPQDVFNKDDSKKSHPIALVVPILSVVFSIISIKISQKNSNMTEEQMEMQKSMNIMMPLLSASISYSMPLALGIYWLMGSILGILQQLFINKAVKKNEDLLKLSKGGI